MEKGTQPESGGRPKSRILSEALRNRLAEVKPDDPVGRTYAEMVATNLVDIACSEGPGAVHAANEIAGSTTPNQAASGSLYETLNRPRLVQPAGGRRGIPGGPTTATSAAKSTRCNCTPHWRGTKQACNVAA